MNKDIEKIVKRRFRSLKERCERLNIDPPSYNDFLRLFKEGIENGFSCFYCGKKLKIKDKYPYKDVPSVDHKIPLLFGGNNNYSNLVLCCHQCNIIKGTMTASTFKRMISLLKNDPDLLNDMFDEMFRGRFANKMERLNFEKNFGR